VRPRDVFTACAPGGRAPPRQGRAPCRGEAAGGEVGRALGARRRRARAREGPARSCFSASERGPAVQWGVVAAAPLLPRADGTRRRRGVRLRDVFTACAPGGRAPPLQGRAPCRGEAAGGEVGRALGARRRRARAREGPARSCFSASERGPAVQWGVVAAAPLLPRADGTRRRRGVRLRDVFTACAPGGRAPPLQGRAPCRGEAAGGEVGRALGARRRRARAREGPARPCLVRPSVARRCSGAWSRRRRFFRARTARGGGGVCGRGTSSPPARPEVAPHLAGSRPASWRGGWRRGGTSPRGS
jgi:hypothetical protein